MARRFPFTTSLSSGEMAPEFAMRTDLQVRNEGALQFRNVMSMAGGGFRRRWGTRDITGLNGLSRLETYGVGDSDARILVFGVGRFEVRTTDGAVQQVITTDVPWTAADLFVMQVAIEDGRIVVACRSWAPRLLTLTSGVWALSLLTFADGLNGSKLAPYWRYAPRGVSLTPNGYSGAGRSMTVSAPTFTAAHVGSRIRYTGVEVSVTAVSSSTVATGTVVGSLYPTLNVTVASSAGYVVGQEVQGADSQVRGVVSNVSGNIVRVQLTEGYTVFDVNENLIGPTAKSKISAVAQNSTPSPTTEWDEQLISAARGYPSACGLHRNRLLMGGFPQAENVMAASATGDITDFDTGSGLETDAIIERVGRESSLGLRHFGSTEQLLLFTEAGVYYVPEQVAAPLSPTNFELLKIGPSAAADPQPLLVDEGMVFIERDSGRAMICVPTGNVRRSWEIADLSETAFHLMGEPVEMELMVAGSESDRLITVLRADGKIAVMTYRRGGTGTAWGVWSTAGSWRSLVVVNGALFAVAQRVIGGVTNYRLERFDETCWADGMVSLPTATTPVTLYANGPIGVWSGVAKIGQYQVGSDGVLQGVDNSYGALDVGRDFTVTVETMPPIDQQMGLRPNYKITRVDVDVVDSVGFKGEGRDPSGWVGATLGGAVPVTSSVRRFRPMGRRKYPTFTMVQDVGGPLQVRSLTMEVTS